MLNGGQKSAKGISSDRGGLVQQVLYRFQPLTLHAWGVFPFRPSMPLAVAVRYTVSRNMDQTLIRHLFATALGC